MTERLNERDWRLISAYLDARLSPAETARVETRLNEDPVFKQSLDEIAHTKRLLASLPHKRAPRNFTLAVDTVTQPLRGLWLQPALSLVSIAAAVILVVVFTFNTFGTITRQAAAPQAEMFAVSSAAVEETPPAIINWNPVMGMGGGEAADKGAFMGEDGVGGAGGPGYPISEPAEGEGETADMAEPLPPPALEPEAPAPAEPALDVTEEPAPEALMLPAPLAQEAEPTTDSNLSDLILGLPEAEEAGTIIQTAPLREEPPSTPQRTFPVSTLIMVIAAIVAVLAGAGAIILRKVIHA